MRLRRLHPMRLLVYSVCLAFVGCTSVGIDQIPTILDRTAMAVAGRNPPPIGLVGLQAMNPFSGFPRTAGEKAVVQGFVVSHPGLPRNLWVPSASNGRPRPVLAFRLTMFILHAARLDQSGIGPEETNGNGVLEIFYKPDGFSDAVLSYSGAIEGTEKIESDAIEFHGKTAPDQRFHVYMEESVVSTHPFHLAGRRWTPPKSRTASDELIGEYSQIFAGAAYASKSPMAPLSPEEKLVVLAGAPATVVHY